MPQDQFSLPTILIWSVIELRSTVSKLLIDSRRRRNNAAEHAVSAYCNASREATNVLIDRGGVDNVCKLFTYEPKRTISVLGETPEQDFGFMGTFYAREGDRKLIFDEMVYLGGKIQKCQSGAYDLDLENEVKVHMS